MFPCRTRGELWRSFCETVSEFSDSIESATLFVKTAQGLLLLIKENKVKF